MNHIDELTGIVDKVVFQSTDNGFAVFILQINQNTSTTVRGYLHNIQPGEQVSIQGTWVTSS